MAVKILGIGKALPPKRVSNDDLATKLDTSDEWIRSHSGIGARYISESKDETSADLGAQACVAALENAKKHGTEVATADIDLIICSTSGAAHWSFPSNACLIQKTLGCEKAAAFDVAAACSGFIYAMSIATSLMKSNGYKKALIVGAEKLSRICDWEDRATCVLFGDGAGAMVLENDGTNEEDSMKSFILGSDGNGAEHLYLDPESLVIKMNGQAVYFFAVAKMAEIMKTLMEKENLTYDDVDLFVCHQANERIISSAAKRLKLPMDKFPLSIGEYANTSSASIPILLSCLEEEGKLKKGMKLLLAGFGAGLTWGGCSIVW